RSVAAGCAGAVAARPEAARSVLAVGSVAALPGLALPGMAPPGMAPPVTGRPVPVPAGGAAVAAGLAGEGCLCGVPARPGADDAAVGDVPVDGAAAVGRAAGCRAAGCRAAGGRGRGGVGLVPGPRPGGGMSRTLPVLGNSYGIVLATVG